ncbi:DeoR/GlpR family DNA-binding transcription regulator [Vagococcus fessus]|uniref:HTH deoR-type domain-containing protein n=1 Tax=Vagococcus fessus TaxID=120370 RepID=A0A430ABJ8_9ENTE|nr:DeoR/GlpR family DNA-binding transcription regulator [Vagococcus fessus]RSU04607.1 hypothetical protein CBF31_00905 [Vagococcus fessus]
MTKIEKRHKKILELLSSTPLATTAELSEKLGVSSETIRKDLKILSEEKLITQTHGGVALSEGKNINYPFDYRMKINSKSKQKIGKKAVGLVEKDDVILLENSTTSLALARELCKNKELLDSLVIVTTSFKIAAQLDEIFKEYKTTCRLFFVGGWTNFEQHGTFGLHTMETLKSIHVKKAFLSGAALDSKFRLSGYTDEDVAFQKNAILYSEQVVLMIEKGKFPKSGFSIVGNIEEVDYIVTDIPLNSELVRKLEAVDVQLIEVE